MGQRTLQNRFVCSQMHLAGKFLNTAGCCFPFGNREDKRNVNSREFQSSRLIRKEMELTTGVVRLLLACQDVGKPRLLLRLVQYIVPVGRQKRAAVKVHWNTTNMGPIDY